MLTDTIVIVGGVDGTLLVFDINRRKPVITVPAAHGYGCVGDGTGLERVSNLASSQSSSTSYTTTANSKNNKNNINTCSAEKMQMESMLA